MQILRLSALAVTTLAIGALVLMPVMTGAQEAVEPAPDASAQAQALEEEQARVREEIERNEAERAQARQKNCETARAELERLSDLPARNVLQTTEDGTVTRMTEEEHAAHLEQWRKAEAENCQ